MTSMSINEKFKNILMEENGEDDEGADEIKVINNDIYFYCDITTATILNLTHIIRTLTNKLLHLNINYNINLNINLHINSDGGEVYAVLSILHLIENNKIDIHTIVEGRACSSATILSLFGKKRYITKNSYMLIHNISSGFWGKMHEIEDEMKNLGLLTRDIKKMYRTYSNITTKNLDNLLKKDLLLTANVCLKHGLIDAII